MHSGLYRFAIDALSYHQAERCDIADGSFRASFKLLRVEGGNSGGENASRLNVHTAFSVLPPTYIFVLYYSTCTPAQLALNALSPAQLTSLQHLNTSERIYGSCNYEASFIASTETFETSNDIFQIVEESSRNLYTN